MHMFSFVSVHGCVRADEWTTECFELLARTLQLYSPSSVLFCSLLIVCFAIELNMTNVKCSYWNDDRNSLPIMRKPNRFASLCQLDGRCKNSARPTHNYVAVRVDGRFTKRTKWMDLKALDRTPAMKENLANRRATNMCERTVRVIRVSVKRVTYFELRLWSAWMPSRPIPGDCFDLMRWLWPRSRNASMSHCGDATMTQRCTCYVTLRR